MGTKKQIRFSLTFGKYKKSPTINAGLLSVL
jgi:hypothetical protein